MSNAVPRAVTRSADRLRTRAVARYRTLLAGDSSIVVRIVLVVATLAERGARTARNARRAPAGAARLRRRADASRVRRAHRGELVVSRAHRTESGELSLRLDGPPDLAARVRGLRLERAGTAPVELDTAVTTREGVVLLAAHLPDPPDTAASSAWTVRTHDGAGTTLGPFVTDAAALSAPGLDADAGHHLLVTTGPTGPAPIAHRVGVGLITATVEWGADPSRASDLRLRAGDGSEEVLPSGTGARAVVDLAALAGRGEHAWTVSIGAGTGWTELRRAPGAARGPLAELPVRRADGRYVQVQVGYRDDLLTVTVGGRS